MLSFGPTLPKHADRAVASYNLSYRGDSLEAAQNLFSALRSLSTGKNVRMIAVNPHPR